MPFSTARFEALGAWLAEARYAFLSLGVIAVALFVSLRPHTSEPVIRWTGLALQLLGVFTVVRGISDTKAFFGHPSFARQTKDWLSRFPFLRRNVILAASGVALSSAVGHARAHVTHEPGRRPTVEARLVALEKNVASIHERISQTQSDTDRGFHAARKTLSAEAQTRQAEAMAIREKLEITGTGGLHLAAIGASWFFVGTILGTAAIEISAWLK